MQRHSHCFRRLLRHSLYQRTTREPHWHGLKVAANKTLSIGEVLHTKFEVGQRPFSQAEKKTLKLWNLNNGWRRHGKGRRTLQPWLHSNLSHLLHAFEATVLVASNFLANITVHRDRIFAYTTSRGFVYLCHRREFSPSSTSMCKNLSFAEMPEVFISILDCLKYCTFKVYIFTIDTYMHVSTLPHTCTSNTLFSPYIGCTWLLLSNNSSHIGQACTQLSLPCACCTWLLLGSTW